MRLHRVFARLGLPSAKIKNRGKTDGRNFGKVEDHQIRLLQPGRRAAQDLFQEWRGTSVRRRSFLGSACDDGGAVSRPLLSRPDQNPVSQIGSLKTRADTASAIAGLSEIGTRPVDSNRLLALDTIRVGSPLSESGNLSALPACSRSASREARRRTPARKPSLPVMGPRGP
jgi:hypothetical protein